MSVKLLRKKVLMKQPRPTVNNVLDNIWCEGWRRRKGRIKKKRTKKAKGVLAARSFDQIDPSSVCLNVDHWYYHSFPSLHVPHHLDLLMIFIILIPILHQNQFLCPDPDNFDPADPDLNSHSNTRCYDDGGLSATAINIIFFILVLILI